MAATAPIANAPRAQIRFDAPRGYWERLQHMVGPRGRRALAVAALAALGAFWGMAIGLGGVAALIVFVAMLACVFCLRDFRAGVALLIVIMPISQSYVFPHAMFGMTGMNPLNLLVATALGVYVLRHAGEKGAIAGFVPRQVAWLYILPMAMGAFLGMGHVGSIPSIFRDTDMIFFDDATCSPSR